MNSIIAMSSTTKQATIATPVKSNVNRIPKTPSLVPHDDFDLTPNTQTTHSFADSGFFSGADGTYGAVTGCKDWVLFPDVDGLVEAEFDTNGFFKDADEIMNYSHEADHGEVGQASPPASLSLELPPLNKSFDPMYTNDSRNLTQSLELHYISSPPPSPRARSTSPPTFSVLSNESDDVSMLEIWQRSQNRSERIAYKFEQPPYAQREHLLPMFRQSSRVRRRSGSAKRNRRTVGL